MGRQDDFSLEVVSSQDVEVSSRTSDTVSYITDLLSELQTIATISGLNKLSEDLTAVMSKHKAPSVNA